MKNKNYTVVTMFILSIFILSSCSPKAQASQAATTSSAETTPLIAATPTPIPLCDNQYFPHAVGDSWTYSGTNSAISSYTRTDTVTASTADSFSLDTTLAGVTYPITYTCSAAGLTVTDPVEQYLGALLSDPNVPGTIKLTSYTGTTLPAKISPGDTWQQSADFEATYQKVNLNGRFVFDYSAVGFENVTVPFGTFSALRVDTTIHIQLSALHIQAGTYTLSNWLVPGIGVVKSVGASQVPQISFTDSMELTQFVHVK